MLDEVCVARRRYVVVRVNLDGYVVIEAERVVYHDWSLSTGLLVDVLGFFFNPSYYIQCTTDLNMGATLGDEKY